MVSTVRTFKTCIMKTIRAKNKLMQIIHFINFFSSYMCMSSFIMLGSSLPVNGIINRLSKQFTYYVDPHCTLIPMRVIHHCKLL